jgi:hypothetical protein
MCMHAGLFFALCRVVSACHLRQYPGLRRIQKARVHTHEGQVRAEGCRTRFPVEGGAYEMIVSYGAPNSLSAKDGRHHLIEF